MDWSPARRRASAGAFSPPATTHRMWRDRFKIGYVSVSLRLPWYAPVRATSASVMSSTGSPGTKGGGVPVCSKSQVDKVEDGRRTGDRRQLLSIARGRRVEVHRFHRHRMDLRRAQRDVCEQALAQAGEIPIGVPQRGNALVDLDHVHPVPRHLFARQRVEHPPRSPAPADGQDEAGALANGCPSVRGDDRRCRLGDGISITKNVGLHLMAAQSPLPHSCAGWFLDVPAELEPHRGQQLVAKLRLPARTEA